MALPALIPLLAGIGGSAGARMIASRLLPMLFRGGAKRLLNQGTRRILPKFLKDIGIGKIANTATGIGNFGADVLGFDAGSRLGNLVVSPEHQLPPDIPLDIAATAGAMGAQRLVGATGKFGALAASLGGALGGTQLYNKFIDREVNQAPIPRMDDNADGMAELLNTLLQEEEKEDGTLNPVNPNLPMEMF